MSGHDRNFVALDLAFESDGGAAVADPLAKQLDHRLHVAAIHVQFLGDWATGPIQAHETQTNHPDPERLVVPGEAGIGQVVEPLVAAMAKVALAMRWCLISAILDEGSG